MLPPGFRRVFRNPFGPRALRSEIEEEIAFHLHAKERDLTEQGVEPDRARREARRQFGSPERWRRRAVAAARRRERRERGVDALGSYLQDLAGALRHFRRRPGFALFCVTILSLGIAAGTAVFAVLDTVLFRPMPFPDPHRIVAVQGSTNRYPGLTVSPANYFDWKAGQRSFSAMAATRATSVTLFTGSPEALGTLAVESDFFDVIGVHPTLGRRILPEDDKPNAPRVAVVTHGAWRRIFAGDPDALGRQVDGSAGPVTIVGVMPPDFRYLDVPFWGGPERDLFLSDPFGSDRTSRTTGGYLWVGARLMPGVSIEQADAQMKDVAARLAEEYPGINGPSADDSALSIRVVDAHWDAVELIARPFLLMGVATALLLLVVCMNAAGVLLTWVLDRRRELAVRAALGAARHRLIRQVMAETGWLSVVGTAVGVGLAALLVRVVPGLVPGSIPRLDEVALDGRVLGGALLFSLTLWLASAALPAIRGSKVNLSSSLKDGARTITPGRAWIGRTIIVGQLALTCALVAGAARLIHTYSSLVQVHPGLDPANTLALHVRLPADRYTEQVGSVGALAAPDALGHLNEAWQEQIGATPVYRVGAEAADFVRRVGEELRKVPGIRSVAFANEAPFSGGQIWGTLPFDPGTGGLPLAEREKWAYLKWVSPNFFETLQVPLLRGRVFGETDGPGDPPVVIVNDAYVDTFFGGAVDPVGAAVRFPEDPYFPEKEATVVGVVANTLQQGPHQPFEPVLYVPLAQRAPLWNRYQRAFPLRSTFLIRTDGEPTVLANDVRRAMWSVDPEVPVSYLRTLEDMLLELSAEPRFFLFLLSGFALVSLLLAAAGTFGLLVHDVQQRTHEIGVRRALGATSGSVTGRVLREGAALAVTGVALGLAGALAAGRTLASLIVGLTDWSPVVQLLVACVLVITVLGASWLPARRAGGVDPLEALRAD
jgi:ABC-type lipoprotein release transport system permease subunit